MDKYKNNEEAHKALLLAAIRHNEAPSQESAMDKPIPESVVEAVARAICVACEENPDHRGDARGNEFRWQDYRDTALAAINTLTAAQQQGQPAPPSATVWVEGRYHPCTHILIDGLKRLEGGTAVLAEWDRARAQADAALAGQQGGAK